jgi:hypothetical protein
MCKGNGVLGGGDPDECTQICGVDASCAHGACAKTGVIFNRWC